MSPQKCKPVVPVQKSTDFGKISVTGYSHTAAKLKEEVPVNIKYLNLDEVNAKRQKELMFKQKFLVKMKFLNSQGEKMDFLNKVENWIEDNLPLL